MGLYAALCTYNSVHFALTGLSIVPACFASITAISATLWLVFETFFSIEFLLSHRESKGGSAVFAYGRLASSFALRRCETLSRCRRDVTAVPATSRGIGCASEYCKRRRIERIGLLDPAPASSFPISPSRCSSRLRLPDTYASGSSSRALSFPSESTSQRPPGPPSRRPSGLRKTTITLNSLAHRTSWLRSDFRRRRFRPRPRGVPAVSVCLILTHPAHPPVRFPSLQSQRVNARPVLQVGGQAVLGRQL